MPENVRLIKKGGSASIIARLGTQRNYHIIKLLVLNPAFTGTLYLNQGAFYEKKL